MSVKRSRTFWRWGGKHLRHQFAQGHNVAFNGGQAVADQAGQFGAFALAAGLSSFQTLVEQRQGFGIQGLRVAGVGHQHARPGEHFQRVDAAGCLIRPAMVSAAATS